MAAYDEVEIRKFPAQRIALIRYEATAQDAFIQVESALSTVWASLEESGSVPAGPPFSLRADVELDTPMPPPEPWRLESGFPIEDELVGSGPIEIRELAAAEAACLMVHGDYSELVEAYLFLQAWIEASGHEPAAPPREVYLTDPVAESNVEKWRTEIQWPLKS